MAGLAAQARQDRAQLGIMMMLGAYFLFAGIDTSAKWLVVTGYPAMQLAFMRYAGHLVLSSVQIARGGLALKRYSTAQPGLVILRAALLASSTALNFFVLQYLPLTLTSAILFSAPILVCVLSMPILGERVGPYRWLAIGLGFVGILIVIRPFGASFHWAALLAFVNAISFALYSILTRKLSGQIAAETMQIYTGAVGTLFLMPFAIYSWQTPAGPGIWLLMIGLGFFGWAGHELLTRAHGFAPASVLMPYGYSFMIYLSISSYLLFGTLPDPWTVLGAVIIVASGLIIWSREKRRDPSHAPR